MTKSEVEKLSAKKLKRLVLSAYETSRVEFVEKDGRTYTIPVGVSEMFTETDGSAVICPECGIRILLKMPH